MRILKQLAVVAFTLVALYLLALPLHAQSQEFTITDCSNDTALRAAVSAHHTIDFNCGNATITLQAPLLITDSVVIDGGGMITLTGGGITHHFVITGNSAFLRVSNMSLSDGFAEARTGIDAPLHPAGSIYNASNAEFINVTFLDNRAEGPAGVGGIYNRGSLTVVNSRFFNQQGGYVGALINDNRADIDDSLFENNRGDASGALLTRGSISINDSTFNNNQSSEGSGAYLQQPDTNPELNGHAALRDLIFTNNSGQTCGAIASDSSSIYIYSTTISTNTASAGGALCIEEDEGSSAGFVVNSTISGNHSLGAAITASASFIGMRNVTIVSNVSAAGDPGGLHVNRDSLLRGFSLIIARNGNQNCSLRNPANQSLSHSVIGDQSCDVTAYGQEENTLYIADPLLAPLADNGGPTLTHLPHPDSPARAIGRYCETVDQRGIVRWKDTCDAGSVEVEQRPIRQHLPLIEILDTYPTPTATPLPE